MRRSGHRSGTSGAVAGMLVAPLYAHDPRRPPVGRCEDARSKTRQLIMARSMWRGAIQFGLVTIPAKLYLATEQGGIGANILHKACRHRIQIEGWCPHDVGVASRSE